MTPDLRQANKRNSDLAWNRIESSAPEYRQTSPARIRPPADRFVKLLAIAGK